MRQQLVGDNVLPRGFFFWTDDILFAIVLANAFRSREHLSDLIDRDALLDPIILWTVHDPHAGRPMVFPLFWKSLGFENIWKDSIEETDPQKHTCVVFKLYGCETLYFHRVVVQIIL